MDDAAAAQDRHPIGAADDFTDPVRDQADADASGRQIAHTPYETLHLTRPEHGRRLIQQQEAGILRQSDQQLAHLTFNKREPASWNVQRHGNAGALRSGCELVARSAQIGAHALLSENIVLDQSERADQRQSLRQEADTGGNGILAPSKRRLLPVDANFAAVGLVDAGEDLRQRRFAGAVLADDRVDFARTKLEVRVGKRLQRREGLGQAACR